MRVCFLRLHTLHPVARGWEKQQYGKNCGKRGREERTLNVQPRFFATMCPNDLLLVNLNMSAKTLPFQFLVSPWIWTSICSLSLLFIFSSPLCSLLSALASPLYFFFSNLLHSLHSTFSARLCPNRPLSFLYPPKHN